MTRITSSPLSLFAAKREIDTVTSANIGGGSGGGADAAGGATGAVVEGAGAVGTGGVVGNYAHETTGIVAATISPAVALQ